MRKRRISEKLKLEWHKEKSKISRKRYYYVRFPNDEEHTGGHLRGEVVTTCTLKEETFAEETFASGKIREIFGRNFREFRELANFQFFARIIFREFML